MFQVSQNAVNWEFKACIDILETQVNKQQPMERIVGIRVST